MAQNFPRLCGGTFLTLLLRALKKKHRNGSKQGLTEPECFMGLIRVITPKYDFPAAESTIRQDTSKYKNCVLDPSKSTWLPFAVPEHMSPFDEAVRSNYDMVLRRMIDFADKFLDMDVMGNWLVNALLELIADDGGIKEDTPFFVQSDGISVTKTAMLQQSNFKIQPFLLGIWHYVAMNVADSTIGQETLESYLTDAPSEKGDKRTLKNAIGRSKRFHIEVGVMQNNETDKATHNENTKETADNQCHYSISTKKDSSEDTSKAVNDINSSKSLLKPFYVSSRCNEHNLSKLDEVAINLNMNRIRLSSNAVEFNTKNIYKFNDSFSLKSVYGELGVRQIKVTTLCSNTVITGLTSVDRWKSVSYLQNAMANGKIYCIAYFEILNITDFISVHFLMMKE